jgi:hypothetical protein
VTRFDTDAVEIPGCLSQLHGDVVIRPFDALTQSGDHFKVPELVVCERLLVAGG